VCLGLDELDVCELFVGERLRCMVFGILVGKCAWMNCFNGID
jgi:hypothetical protein